MGNVVLEVGVYHTDTEFNALAKDLTHPFDMCAGVEDCVLEALFGLLVQGPGAIKAKRAAAFDHYMRLAASLSNEEKSLHANLPRHCAHVMEGKKFLLFKQMCKDARIADPHLDADYVRGIDLAGRAHQSFEFNEQSKPARLSVEHVRQASKWTRRAAVAKPTKSNDAQLDSDVWAATKEEISKGWLHGPYSEKDLAKMLGLCS